MGQVPKDARLVPLEPKAQNVPGPKITVPVPLLVLPVMVVVPLLVVMLPELLPLDAVMSALPEALGRAGDSRRPRR